MPAFRSDRGMVLVPEANAAQLRASPRWEEIEAIPEDPEAEPAVVEAPAPKATDAAIELAAAEGVTLDLVKGTGQGGQIVKADVERVLRGGSDG